MNTLLGNRLSGLRDSIHRNWQEKALRRDRAAEVLHTLETVVDDLLAEQPDIYFEAGDHEQLIHVSAEVFQMLLGDRIQHGQFSH